ncbi:hypothetical protein [Microbacterium sp. Leaf320]|uniref:hypothetical protein n=1 Tax=Microbacterium sp. Leaf320 TaxID=1736334 RepID=UPI0006FC39D7|nr:hypothetical protein [Microbacterium sp. Leaf320]KQQ62663.1 hypothetical protein ASF63_18040 [Microbacterium sp. Leaf320]
MTTPQLFTRELPSVRLGASGSAIDLDRCDGTFTEMVDYRQREVPPVWAAHNNCGGDTILPWKEGQRFLVGDEEYEVVEVRLLPKYTATPKDLLGMKGELALQTCLYGEPLMSFVGATSVRVLAEE